MRQSDEEKGHVVWNRQSLVQISAAAHTLGKLFSSEDLSFTSGGGKDRASITAEQEFELCSAIPLAVPLLQCKPFKQLQIWPTLSRWKQFQRNAVLPYDMLVDMLVTCFNHRSPVSSHCCGWLFHFYVIVWQIPCIRSQGYGKSMPQTGLGCQPANSKLPLLPRAPGSNKLPRNPQPAVNWSFSPTWLFRREFCSVIVLLVIVMTCMYQNPGGEWFPALVWREPCGLSRYLKGYKTSQVETRFNLLLQRCRMKHKTAMSVYFWSNHSLLLFQGKVKTKGTSSFGGLLTLNWKRRGFPFCHHNQLSRDRLVSDGLHRFTDEITEVVGGSGTSSRSFWLLALHGSSLRWLLNPGDLSWCITCPRGLA